MSRRPSASAVSQGPRRSSSTGGLSYSASLWKPTPPWHAATSSWPHASSWARTGTPATSCCDRQLRAERGADLQDDVDEPAGTERTPEPVRPVGQLDPCPRREAGVERRPRVGVHRAVGQGGHEPPAECDEQRGVRKLDHRKAGRPTVLRTPPEVPERAPGLHPRDPNGGILRFAGTPFRTGLAEHRNIGPA